MTRSLFLPARPDYVMSDPPVRDGTPAPRGPPPTSTTAAPGPRLACLSPCAGLSGLRDLPGTRPHPAQQTARACSQGGGGEGPCARSATGGPPGLASREKKSVRLTTRRSGEGTWRTFLDHRRTVGP